MNPSQVQPTEYRESYKHYIQLTPDLEITAALNQTHQATIAFFEKLDTDKLEHRYAAGKWTPKDILQHIIDNERIQSYRALAFSRQDTSVQPGFDQDVYADNSVANTRTVEDLLEEFKVVRQSSIVMFRDFTNEMLHYEGTCFSLKITPLALGFINIGHAQHHLNVLKEKYFK